MLRAMDDDDDAPIIRRNQAGQFAPGQSGNVLGRPKGISLRRLLRDSLTPEQRQALVDRYYLMAMEDPRAMRGLIEDHDGRLPQQLDHVGAIHTTITVGDATPQEPEIEDGALPEITEA